MNGIEKEFAAQQNERPDHQAIAVDIYDQIYHLRGTDLVYIEQLAQMVDNKMRAVAQAGGTVDSLRVAVLASLNIADELECLRARYTALAGSLTQSQTTMRTRSASLAGMLDEVFDEESMPIRRAG